MLSLLRPREDPYTLASFDSSEGLRVAEYRILIVVIIYKAGPRRAVFMMDMDLLTDIPE